VTLIAPGDDRAAPTDPAVTVARLRRAVGSIVRGKLQVIDLALTTVVAGGHLLLQDVPGVGKTTLASTLARAVGGSFARIQFTSDLLPGDITGVSVLEGSTGRFSFRPGPVFANVVMADEINRTTPKTQSALFEAMEEGRVTVDGETRLLPRPFLVVATQNPYDFHGTFPLPDSQLDRFLMRISMGYPDRESERAVLRRETTRPELAEATVSAVELAAVVEAAATVEMPTQIEECVLDLVRATREDARLLRGVSTRGAQMLYRAIRAYAVVQGRRFAVPEDLLDLAVPVLGHRVQPRLDGGPAGEGGPRAIAALLDDLPNAW
jgi:MoxR-like ATPase